MSSYTLEEHFAQRERGGVDTLGSRLPGTPDTLIKCYEVKS